MPHRACQESERICGARERPIAEKLFQRGPHVALDALGLVVAPERPIYLAQIQPGLAIDIGDARIARLRALRPTEWPRIAQLRLRSGPSVRAQSRREFAIATGVIIAAQPIGLARLRARHRPPHRRCHTRPKYRASAGGFPTPAPPARGNTRRPRDPSSLGRIPQPTERLPPSPRRRRCGHTNVPSVVYSADFVSSAFSAFRCATTRSIPSTIDAARSASSATRSAVCAGRGHWRYGLSAAHP